MKTFQKMLKSRYLKVLSVIGGVVATAQVASADIVSYDPATEAITWDFGDYLTAIMTGIAALVGAVALIWVVLFVIKSLARVSSRGM